MQNLIKGGSLALRTRKLVLLLVAIPLSGGLAGCASYPNSGPKMGQLVSGKTDLQMPIDLIDLSPSTIAAYTIRPDQDLPASERFPASAERFTLSPGDVITVTVFGSQFGSAIGTTEQSGGLFKSVVDGGNLFGPLRVSSAGTITLPYVNDIHAAGKTPSALEHEIASDLATTKQIDEPAVEVAVMTTTSLVHVSGDVHTPGDYSLIDGPSTVLDAINKAGGPMQSAIQSDVVLRRNGTVDDMPMEQLLLGGGDVPLQPGDDIVVQAKPKGFIAMGAVLHSGSFPFLSRSPSLLDALGQIGGLVDTQADPTGVFVFRQLPASGVTPGKPIVFVLDFSRPTALFLANEFAIMPEDVVYVTNAPLYQAGKAIGIISSTGGLVRNGTAF